MAQKRDDQQWLTVLVEKDLIKRIEHTQPDYLPFRSEWVRRLLMRALDEVERKRRPSKKKDSE